MRKFGLGEFWPSATDGYKAVAIYSLVYDVVYGVSYVSENPGMDANLRWVNLVDVNASVHPVSLVNANIKTLFFVDFPFYLFHEGITSFILLNYQSYKKGKISSMEKYRFFSSIFL